MDLSTFVKKADAKFATEWETLPEVSRNHIIAYGFRQIIADACASAKTESEAKGMCAKRLDNLIKGVLQAPRESDPIAKEARRIAVDITTAWAKKNGVALVAKDDADDKAKAAVAKNQETFTARVEALRTNDKVLAQARKNVEAAAALGDLDIDL
jgi:hypothetical protein